MNHSRTLLTPARRHGNAHSRVMDMVAESGTGFAFPSQTLYLGRDGGLDTKRTEVAEAQVRRWRDEGRLPFPDFSPEQMERIRGSLVYPPPGSTAGSAASPGATARVPEGPR